MSFFSGNNNKETPAILKRYIQNGNIYESFFTKVDCYMQAGPRYFYNDSY